MPFVAPKRDRNHVRFGSKADIAALPINVRFTPKSALPPKADMDQSRCDVRFVPEATLSGAAIDRSY